MPHFLCGFIAPNSTDEDSVGPLLQQCRARSDFDHLREPHIHPSGARQLNQALVALERLKHLPSGRDSDRQVAYLVLKNVHLALAARLMSSRSRPTP